MAWARPPDAPELPASPLDALQPREDDYKSLYEHNGLPICTALIGLLAPGFINKFTKRPFYTGIWKFPITGFVLGYLGYQFQELRNEIYNEKKEVLRQYIKLHPEDFPAYRRVLIKNTIEPWNPQR